MQHTGLHLPEYLITTKILVGPFIFKTTRVSPDMTSYAMTLVADTGAMAHGFINYSASSAII